MALWQPKHHHLLSCRVIRWLGLTVEDAHPVLQAQPGQAGLCHTAFARDALSSQLQQVVLGGKEKGLFSTLLLSAALEPSSGKQKDTSFHLEQLGKPQAVEEERTFSREGVQV